MEVPFEMETFSFDPSSPPPLKNVTRELLWAIYLYVLVIHKYKSQQHCLNGIKQGLKFRFGSGKKSKSKVAKSLFLKN